jgi:hypothetical protein
MRFLIFERFCSCFNDEGQIEERQIDESHKLEILQPRTSPASSSPGESPLKENIHLHEFTNIDQSLSRIEDFSINNSDIFSAEDVTDLLSPNLSDTGTFRYKSGAVYHGSCRQGRRHGNGELRWTGDMWYRGEWEDGHPKGQGTMQLEPGVRFNGPWIRRDYQGSENLHLISSFPEWLGAIEDGYGTS